MNAEQRAREILAEVERGPISDYGTVHRRVAHEAIARALQAQQPEGREAVAFSVLEIGARGSAYDLPDTRRAFTYEHQPGNIIASRIGGAAYAAEKGRAGDSIDKGLGLLKALQEAGFGVFQISPAITPPAKVPEGDDVVGHKTFSDGRGGFRHEPLTRAEADALLAHCRSEDERRKALMPDERSAIRMMMDAHTRLTDMGWRDPIYCPKDGSTFEVIEPGSTGIHKCIYMGEWPKGSWWALGDGDMYPSRPVLFRPLAAAQQPKEGA